MASSEAIVSQLGEIIPFLAPKQRVDVRKAALDLVVSLSGDVVFQALADLGATPHLVRMICADDVTLAQNSLKTLVNISSLNSCRTIVISSNAVERALDALKDGELRDRHELAVMLLSNLTKEDNACQVVLQTDTMFSGLHVLRLLRLFVKPVLSASTDVYAHVADVLTNLSQIESGRLLLLDPKRGVLPRLVPYLRSDNQVRKLGVLRTIRNCAYEHKQHEQLLSEELGLLSELLIPLAGPEPIDSEDCEGMLPKLKAELHYEKRRESNAEARQIILEIIDMFARVKPSRLYLKSVKAYPILRELHLWEEEPDALDFIEDLVQWFLADEEDASPDEKRAVESRIEEISDEIEAL